MLHNLSRSTRFFVSMQQDDASHDERKSPSEADSASASVSVSVSVTGAPELVEAAYRNPHADTTTYRSAAIQHPPTCTERASSPISSSTIASSIAKEQPGHPSGGARIGPFWEPPPAALRFAAPRLRYAFPAAALPREHVSLPPTQPRPSFVKPLLKSQADGQVQYCGWKLPIVGTLSRLSPIVPLSPHHTRVSTAADLRHLLTNLSTAFRCLSLEVKYQDEPTLSAALYSMEGVELLVSLFSGQEQQDARYPEVVGTVDQRTTVVVDVHCACGDTSVFKAYASRIVKAASGTMEWDMLTTRDFGVNCLVLGDANTYDAFIKGNESILELERASKRHRVGPNNSHLATRHYYSDVRKVLQKIHVLVKAAGSSTFAAIRSRHMALERLGQLVDPRKARFDMLALTSRVILLGAHAVGIDEGGEMDDASTRHWKNVDHDLQEFVVSLIKTQGCGDPKEYDIAESLPYDSEFDANGFFDSTCGRSGPESRRSRELLLMALSVLSHSLIVAHYVSDGSSDVVDQLVRNAHVAFEADLISALLKEVDHAAVTTHSGYLATRCLWSIVMGSRDARGRLGEMGAMATINRALEYGSNCHIQLERETRALLSAL